MSKSKRKIRQIVKYQTKESANPLTKRGRKWIKKEIKFMSKDKQEKLRFELENQVIMKSISSPYWQWLESHGYKESYLANCDNLDDIEDNYSEESQA